VRTSDRSDVVRALVGLADTLVADYDVYDLLQRLVDEGTRLLDVSAAGLLLAGEDGRLRVAAASSEKVRVLELIQLQVDRGPCLEAFARGEAVVAGDPLELRRRWSEFATDVAAAGFLSVAAVPLRLRGRTLGVMGMFSDREHAPGPDDVELAQGLADMATIALLHQRQVEDSRAVTTQLQRALESRVLIEQAKGVVASQSGIDVGDAFAVIRDHARASHVPLRQVAQDLVDGRSTAADLRPRLPPPERSGRW
jgi:GAF domain-containing protein